MECIITLGIEYLAKESVRVLGQPLPKPHVQVAIPILYAVVGYNSLC